MARKILFVLVLILALAISFEARSLLPCQVAMLQSPSVQAHMGDGSTLKFGIWRFAAMA